MKKNLLKASVICMMLMAGASAQAQIDLGNVIKGVAGAATKGASDNLVSNLTSVFSSKKQATADNLIGTWVYNEPAIVFTSNNMLTNAAAKVASNKIEKKLQSQLDKYGIKKGLMSITFQKDGTFSEVIKGKTIKGTWKVTSNKLQLIYGGVKAVNITTQLSGGNLQVVTDASKLLNLFKTVSAKSNVTSLKTVSTLMSGVKGMQAGMTLKKK